MAAEYLCCECGRHVTALDLEAPPEIRLCFVCIHVPGWFRDAQMRAFVCADHDGVEAWERDVSGSARSEGRL